MNRLFIIFIFVFSTALNASGDSSIGEKKSMACAGCHGPNGNSLMPNFPKLAGQGEGYLVKQLKDYKSGARFDPIMAGQVAALSDQDMEDIATYFSTQKITQGFAKKGANIELGEKIYRGGKKEGEVAACIACHGPEGLGVPSAKFPALASQHSMYLVKQINAFRQFSLNSQTGSTTASRSNDYEGMMTGLAKGLTNVEIEAVSEYIAGLH
tara:strand:- start:302 stop:934 length:633 start_codon:yes stop_codon:yes gene_type:complete